MKDFRTFGDFRLTIPPGPGLTLLVGTNGLGKSSFFDGIEWCTTGNVRRFASFAGKFEEGDYLTRRDAPKGSHQVSLVFSDDSNVVRGLGKKPSSEALSSILKDPTWNEIDDLGAFLGFTHFLGQASQQRFTSREKNDQWQALKGPSGIDRLESIRTALRGRPTTFAFKRRAEQETAVVNTAIREVEAWQTSSARLAELQARGAAVGAVSKEILEDSLAAIEQKFPASGVRSATFMTRLGAARSAIEEEQQLVMKSRGELGTLRNLVDRFASASMSFQQEERRLTTAAEGVAAATSQLSEMMLTASRAEQAAAVQADVVARIEGQYQECFRARTALGEMQALEAEWHSAKESETQLRAERGARAADLSSAQRQLTSAVEVKSALARLESAITVNQGWVDRANRMLALEDGASELREAATFAISKAERARLELPALQAALDAARVVETKVAERLTERRKNASELAELLSGLAAHIGHDDVHCPVCASTFVEGELKGRAESALAAQDGQLAEDVRLLEELRISTQGIAHSIALVNAAIMHATIASTSADLAKEKVDAERAALAKGLGVDLLDDVDSIANKRLDDAELAHSTFLHSLPENQLSVSSAQAHVDAMAAALASVDDRLGVALQRFARIETRRTATEAGLSNLERPWSVQAADEAVGRAQKMLEAEREKLEGLTLARAVAANAESASRDRLASAQGEHARIDAAIRDAERVRSLATSNWQQASMSGEPAAELVNAREETLVDRENTLFELRLR